MGIYYALHFKASLKKDKNMFEILRWLINLERDGREIIKFNLKNHPFFNQDRYLSIFYKYDSRDFFKLTDDIFEISISRKNSHEEISLFLHWISPYIKHFEQNYDYDDGNDRHTGISWSLGYLVSDDWECDFCEYDFKESGQEDKMLTGVK